MKCVSRIQIAFLLGLLAFPPALVFSQLPPDFYDEVYRSGFDFPTGLTFDEDGRMFVWEKGGRVKIIDTNGNLLPEPLIDISEEIADWKDHGLMGFTLDPDFLSNGYFYLLYAVNFNHYLHYGTPAFDPEASVENSPTFGRVTRYTADPATNFTTVIGDSRKVLLGTTADEGIPLLYAYHGLGSLIVGQDGTLLISCGDGTSNAGTDIGGDSLGTFVTPALERGIITPDQDIGSYRAQYLGAYNGKILRIDAETGDGLSSNPFFDAENTRSARSRTWALGLRNPYRIVVRPETGSHYPAEGNPGALYIGDVGNGAWEEINITPRGGLNFGWPIIEGVKVNWAFHITDVPANQMATNPLYGAGNCDQEYFSFRDLLQRPKPTDTPFAANPCDPFQPIPSEAFPMTETLPAISWSNAQWNPPAQVLFGIFDETGNLVSAEIEDERTGVAGENFAGYSSLAGVFYQGHQFPEKYRGKYFGVDFSGWIRLFDFNDENQLKSVEPFHDHAEQIIHLAEGRDGALYYVNLANQIRRISYGGNPPPVAVIEADKFYGAGPLEVQFDATNSVGANVPIVQYLWDFGDGAGSENPQPTHTFAGNGSNIQSYTVTLTVTDSLGATAQATKIISLNNTPPQVAISSFEDGDQYPTDRTTVLMLEGEVNDAEHPDEELTYEWRIFFHHNLHFHPEPIQYEPRSHAVIDPLGCGTENYWYRIELTVTDPAGLSATDSREIFPYCGDPIVDWVELEATPEDEAITLDWTTQGEDDLEILEVQRSPDFFNFITIGEVAPAGSVSGEQTYQFVDEAPLPGANIYRIKAKEENGAYSFSNLATVAFLERGALRIFPNPAREAFTIEIEEATAGIVHFELYNPAGVRVLTTDWTAVPEELFRQTMAAGPLQNGIYFYRLVNGEQEIVGRILLRK